ncbi:MAG: putative CRISPR-associated protein, partial [Bacillota bacterium]
MQKICITTVGTSLLTNYSRYKANGGISNIREYLFENPVKASAETNSLQKLREDHELEAGNKIILLTTQTEKAQESAALLKEFAEKRLLQKVEINTLSAWNTEGKISAQALSELTRKIVGIVEPFLTSVYTQKNVIINATGGYKALTSYASIIGLMCGLNVYYIHEEHAAIMTLPPMPLAWDYSLIVDYDEFFAWLSTGIRTKSEVDEQLAEIKQKDAEEKYRTIV